MTVTGADRPDYRFDKDGDWIAREFFSESDLKMPPEEWAARHAHLLACFSLHLYRYKDATLGAWVRRLGEIFTTEGEIERCRHRFLTEEELASVRQQQAEDF
ncbi:MAG: hypothetical protein K2R98_21160 [Gemmataceae bacterium]|nr:hypothetical protein [Gemmataceae bacterium]